MTAPYIFERLQQFGYFRRVNVCLLTDYSVLGPNSPMPLGCTHVYKKFLQLVCSYTLAYCTSIAYGHDPSSLVYDHGRMRMYLLECKYMHTVQETHTMSCTVKEQRIWARLRKHYKLDIV